MAQIVDLKSYQEHQIEKKAFGPWIKRFNEHYTKNACLNDLSDRTLYQLALPGDFSSTAFYELIMGAKNLGVATKFHYLDDHHKMEIIDIHLFIADQVRFEMMRRLAWVERYPCENIPIVSIILSFEHIKGTISGRIPLLSGSHPAHIEFSMLTDRDKESFIRKLLPHALETFKAKVQ